MRRRPMHSSWELPLRRCLQQWEGQPNLSGPPLEPDALAASCFGIVGGRAERLLPAELDQGTDERQPLRDVVVLGLCQGNVVEDLVVADAQCCRVDGQVPREVDGG